MLLCQRQAGSATLGIPAGTGPRGTGRLQRRRRALGPNLQPRQPPRGPRRRPEEGTWAQATDLRIGYDTLYWGATPDGTPVYPPSAPVLDHRGHVRTGLSPDNVVPLCVQQPVDSAERAAADAFLRARAGVLQNEIVPYCPPELLATALAEDGSGALVKKWRLAFHPAENELVYDDANRWAIRGAINAGLAVYLYIDQLSKGLVAPKPLYNQCELLGR